MISKLKIFFQKIKKTNLLKIFAFLFLIVLLGFGFWRNQNSQPTTPKLEIGSIKGFKETQKPVKVKNFSLSIPAVSIQAPIIPNVSGVEKEYLKALERGVVHFKGTSFPGQGGNIVIFGHSAYYRDRPGNYKEVFKNLQDLKKGDLIELDFNHKKYFYQVIKTLVVDPTEAKYMGTTKKERLTLITCVPPGTTRYRLIVIAEPTK